MAYNYVGNQAQLAKAIQYLGLQATVVGVDGKKIKGYGVWSEFEKADIELSVSQVVGEKKLFVMQGTLKASPEVGGQVELGSAVWSIDKVDPVQPANVVLVYEVTMTR